MTEKRPTPGNKNIDHPRKKRRLQDARYISIQSAVRQQEQGLTEDTLDLDTFMESRKFEMESFITAMNNSRHKASQRAFQTVPRELRRRTASHNAKRVPKRLRQRAVSEMTESSSSGPKTHRRKLAFRLRYRKLIATIAKQSQTIKLVGSSLPAKFTSSSTDKTKNKERRKCWMPTHLWCAKRSHMVSKWGFPIAYTPTAKCWKTTYRLSELNGSIIWDMSYIATFALEGRQVDIRKVLSFVCSAQDASFTRQRVVAGLESAATWVFKVKKWPLNPIAPVCIFWCDSKEGRNHIMKPNSPLRMAYGTRTVIIRVHPSASKRVWNELFEAIRDQGSKCLLFDQSRDIGSIRLAGPSTPSVLQQIFYSKRLGDSDDVDIKYEFSTSRRMLHSYVLTTRGENEYYAHAKLPTSIKTKEAQANVAKLETSDPVSSVPSVMQRGCRLVGEETDIQTGRSLGGNYIPVTALSSMFGLKAQTGGPYSSLPNTICNTWTLMIPWIHVLAVWKMLIGIPGVKFGGLRELDEISLMRGEPLFPGDFNSLGQIESEKIAGLSTLPQEVSVAANHLNSNPPIIPPELVSIFLHSSSPYLPRTINHHFFVVTLDYVLGGVPSTGSAIYPVVCSSEVRWRGGDGKHATNSLQHKRLPITATGDIAGHVVRSCLNMKTGRGCGFGWLQWHAAVTAMGRRGVTLSGWCGIDVGGSEGGMKMVLARWIAA